MPSIKLQSSDGKTFPIDLKIAKLSVTIKTMLEDLGMDLENESNEAVPLTNVTAVVLEKVKKRSWTKIVVLPLRLLNCLVDIIRYDTRILVVDLEIQKIHLRTFVLRYFCNKLSA